MEGRETDSAGDGWCVENDSFQVSRWGNWMDCGVLQQARQLSSRTRLSRHDIFCLGQFELNVLLRYLDLKIILDF